MYDVRISRYHRQLQELQQYEAAGLLDPERCQHYRKIFLGSMSELENQRDKIIRTIMELPDRYADLLLLIYVKGLRTADLSAIIDRNIRTISKDHVKVLEAFHDLHSGQSDPTQI